MRRRQIQAALRGLAPGLTLGLAVALAGCGSAAAGDRRGAIRDRPFTVRAVARFDSPWAMSFLPGSGVRRTGLALVSERGGKLWLVDTATGSRRQVGGVPAVRVAGQGGLGDVVADPGFAGNRRIYLTFVEAGANSTSGAALGHGELVIGQGAPQLKRFRIIWRQSPKVRGDGHFGHRIAFAPDGSLFLSSGDRQKFGPAQRLDGDLGKVLHLTAEGTPAPGNPWPRGNPAAWSIGHRNILGLAFAPDGRLWASEMGPRGGDELNRIERGRNYGWPRVSNGSHYDGSDIPEHRTGDGFEPPRVWWNPSISPAGLTIYTGELFPAWRGDALIPALSGEALIRVDIDGDKATKAEQWRMGGRVRAVKQGPGGSVYLIEDGMSGGRLIRLDPNR